MLPKILSMTFYNSTPPFDKFLVISRVNICSQQKLMQIAEHKRGDKMTNIGIVRKVDSLGRVTLPKEFRRIFQMKSNEYIEITATEQGILLRNPDIEVKRITKEKEN